MSLWFMIKHSGHNISMSGSYCRYSVYSHVYHQNCNLFIWWFKSSRYIDIMIQSYMVLLISALCHVFGKYFQGFQFESCTPLYPLVKAGGKLPLVIFVQVTRLDIGWNGCSRHDCQVMLSEYMTLRKHIQFSCVMTQCHVSYLVT